MQNDFKVFYLFSYVFIYLVYLFIYQWHYQGKVLICGGFGGDVVIGSLELSQD